MLKPIELNFNGLVSISGPIKSGKSQLAEFLIKNQKSITYIATSMPRPNDSEWEEKINLHKKRRPDTWKLIEHPIDICRTINTRPPKESILIDSLGGLVEQHLFDVDDEWRLFQKRFVNCLSNYSFMIIVVTEEIGWGIVPATPIGHLFRERLCNLSTLICRQSKKKWLAINGTAVNLDEIGYPIP